MTANRTNVNHPEGTIARAGLLMTALLLMLLILVGCGSRADTNADAEAETAADEGTEEVVEETTTTTTEAVADETEEDVVEADSADTETTAEDADVEPNFALTGELDLTTAEINDMVAFVEGSAGRDFIRPPIIQIVSVEEFEAGLVPDEDMQAAMEANTEAAGRFHQALGHTTLDSEELTAEFADLGTSTDLISGRYDPTDDAIYIPEGVLEGDDFNAILVHELLHALDGQYVDLAGLIEELEVLANEDIASDSAFQIAAVVEGRATVTQFEWMMANNVIPAQTDIPESFNRVPASVVNGVVLPYQLGAQTIGLLGGPAETWDLYENFPATSEQMIFADRIGTDEPITVAAPAVDGEVFTEGVFGAEGMLLLGLGDNLQPSQIEVITTLTAAEGWGGDYFVLTGDETESCLTGSIMADTDADLTELGDLFTEWAGRDTVHPVVRSATIDGDVLTISSCASFIG